MPKFIEIEIAIEKLTTSHYITAFGRCEKLIKKPFYTGDEQFYYTVYNQFNQRKDFRTGMAVSITMPVWRKKKIVPVVI